MRDPELWTAIAFLQATAEFARRVNRQHWSEDALASHEPALVRLRRLTALARAFEIRPSFAALLDGAFLLERDPAAYAAADELAAADLLRLRYSRRHRPLDGWTTSSGASSYTMAVSYLQEAYRLMAFSSGLMEVSGLYLVAVDRIEQANGGVLASLRPVEDLVGLLIAPDGRRFTCDELLPYGWPDVDLFELDVAWF